MKKKILLTGSSGHCGKAIARLLNEEYEITGLDQVAGEYTHVIGSLTDRVFVQQLTKGVDILIHTASLHAPHVSTHTREQFIDTNIKGTLYLLEAALTHGVKKFIYTSSTSLYGESLESKNQAVWITEEVPVIPRDIYDITKIAAEALCKDFFDKEKLQTTVLRVSRFWDEPLSKKVFYRMYRGIDVRDVAFAHKLAMHTPFEKFEVFNISAKSIFTRDDLAEVKNNTSALLKRRIPALIQYYESQGWQMPEPVDRVYVIDKATRMLGFKPAHNIQELLAELESASGKPLSRT